MNNDQILEMGTDELWDAFSVAKKSHDLKTVAFIEEEMRYRNLIPEDDEQEQYVPYVPYNDASTGRCGM